MLRITLGAQTTTLRSLNSSLHFTGEKTEALTNQDPCPGQPGRAAAANQWSADYWWSLRSERLVTTALEHYLGM